MKLISLVVFTCVLLIAETIADAAHARGCARGGRFNLTSAGPWPMRLRAHAGTSCRANFRAHGSTIFRRLFLVTPPQHGKVQLIEGGRYRYSAPIGHATDAFTLRVCGNQNGYEGCADLQYAVTVE